MLILGEGVYIPTLSIAMSHVERAFIFLSRNKLQAYNGHGTLQLSDNFCIYNGLSIISTMEDETSATNTKRSG